ncbi:hypothetical protein [Sulfitobacter sp. JB4-11]|uniref:hypothetical protein n=1 Tax=Sulfitobacter rhodophyticola TaxID=3238304 RepID=UPI003D813CDB
MSVERAEPRRGFWHIDLRGSARVFAGSDTVQQGRRAGAFVLVLAFICGHTFSAHADTSQRSDAISNALIFCAKLTIHPEDQNIDLARAGWVETAAADLDDTAVSALAARSLVNQFTNTAATPRWKPTYEAILRNASGERHKKNVVGGNVTNTYYIRDDDASLFHVLETKVGDWKTAKCAIVISKPLMDGSTLTLRAASELPTPIFSSPNQEFLSQQLRISQFDPARVASAIDVSFAFAAIFGVSTQ